MDGPVLFSQAKEGRCHLPGPSSFVVPEPSEKTAFSLHRRLGHEDSLKGNQRPFYLNSPNEPLKVIVLLMKITESHRKKGKADDGIFKQDTVRKISGLLMGL